MAAGKYTWYLTEKMGIFNNILVDNHIFLNLFPCIALLAIASPFELLSKVKADTTIRGAVQKNIAEKEKLVHLPPSPLAWKGQEE